MNKSQESKVILLGMSIGAIFLYRLCMLYALKLDLYVDEAYYFNWAKHLDWGYYSKPPMLSFLIALTTKLFGDGVLAIKAGALLLYPLTTIVIYFIAKELYDQEIAFWSALAFYTLPSIWLSSLIISTDVVLLFFWALALWFFIRAIKRDHWSDWVLAGVMSGFGLLSKYNFIFFLVSVFLVFITIPHYRHNMRSIKLYTAIAIAFVIFVPNLWWNYQHDFISFVHTKQISQIDKQLLHPNHMLEFLGAQFGLFGPLFFGVFLMMIVRGSFRREEGYRILFYFSITLLGFIVVLSLLSRAFANWAAPAYVSATILVVAYLLHRRKRSWVIGSILFHSLLGMMLYHYHTLAKMAHFQLDRKSDPYHRVMGWSDISMRIKGVRARYEDHFILSKTRASVAEFDYYLGEKTYIFNPKHLMENQYHMDRDLNMLKGKDFIFVGDEDDLSKIAPYFESVKRIKRVVTPIYDNFERSYTLYDARGFKGY